MTPKKYSKQCSPTVVETESKTDTDKLSESSQSESTADTQAQTKPVEQQMQTSNSELVVEADYANLTPSEGFVFESDGGEVYAVIGY